MNARHSQLWDCRAFCVFQQLEPYENQIYLDCHTEVTMPNEYISLLIQIPLVGIFVWFSLRLITIFLDSLEKRDIQWKAFLEEQRKASQDAMAHMAGRFADEIKTLAKEVAEIRGKME
jgi:hypothetical protein